MANENKQRNQSNRAEAVRCPSCGAPVPNSYGQKQVICEYCGTQVMVDDGVQVIRDEARLKELELEEKRLELEYSRSVPRYVPRDKAKVRNWRVIMWATIVINGLLGLSVSDPFTEAFNVPAFATSALRVLWVLGMFAVIPLVAHFRPKEAYGTDKPAKPKSNVACGFLIFFAAIFFDAMLAMIIVP